MQSTSATPSAFANSPDATQRKKQLLLNLFTVVLIVVVVLGAFYQTVFLGKPISRVYQLGQRDTLFIKYFTPVREGYDASVYQYFVPSHVFTTSQLRSGVIPLWNPLVGCGAPYLADVETAVFWPVRWVFSWVQPLRAWNLLIVLNVLNFAIGTFILAKMLELRRFALIYASLVCAFCPFLVFQSELIGSSASMIPLVMASFVNVHRRGTLLSMVLAGLACAVMILSGHPEPSFFGIACASLLFLLLSSFKESPPSNEANPAATLAKKVAFSLGHIAIIGLVAFCFCAFMLLPFLELLRNSDCYKLGLTGHRFGVPLNSILVNLIHPAYNNSSPFLGILAVPLSLYAVWSGWRRDTTVKCLALCCVITISVMSQIGPLDWLMNSKAFSWFVPKYCWPSLLIFFSLLSACGLQSLVDDLQKNWRRASIGIIITSLFVLAFLVAIRVAPSMLACIRQDEAFDHMQVINKFWTRDVICLAVFALVAAASKFFGKAQGMLCVLALAICTVLSIAPVAKIASPVTGQFNYDTVEPIPFLQQHPARILTMGRHVFCPSSNFCYGISNIVPVNVYHPSRFQTFLSGCGVTPEGVNQFFDGRLSPLIDAAAVKYIVTPQPVLSSAEPLTYPSPLTDNAELKWGDSGELKLVGASLNLYPENREILGSLRFSVSAQRATELAMQILLLDHNKNVLWMGDADRLVYLFSKTNEKGNLDVTKDTLIPITNTKDDLTIAIQVFDWKNLAYLPLSKSSEASTNKNSQQEVLAECNLDKGTVVSSIVQNHSVSTSNRRFKLCEETASHIRVYENTKALPQAYLCHNYLAAKDESAAISYLHSKTFSDVHQVVLEDSDLRHPEQAAALKQLTQTAVQAGTHQNEYVRMVRPDCNNISIRVETDVPGILVLSENYYPGWSATVDGARVPIFRANHLFQAVVVPVGQHKIEFSYCPLGFYSGLLLCFLGTVLLIVLMVQRARKKS